MLSVIPRMILKARQHLSEIRRFRRLFSLSNAFELVFFKKAEKIIKIYSRELGKTINLRQNTSDILVTQAILENREYDMAVDFEPLLIIDGGANIGVSSLFFAHRFPNARIHAIEPEPDNFNLLEMNCAGHSNILTHKAALWSHATLLSVRDPSADKWAFSFEQDGSGDTPGITIPSILQLEGAERIDILKLDIEGAEKSLFSNGVAEWLPRVRSIVIELHDRFVPGCSRTFYSAISSRPFSQEVMGENLVIRFTDAQATENIRHHLHA